MLIICSVYYQPIFALDGFRSLNSSVIVDNIYFAVGEYEGEPAAICRGVWDKKSPIEDPVIPDMVVYQDKEYPVIAINKKAFAVEDSRENVLTGILTLPNTLKFIEDDAFSGCSKLNGSLIIPASVTEIGSNAFYGCSGFTGSLTIPESVTTIREGTFYNCGFTGSLLIPNSVTTIESKAFRVCHGFTGSLTIPESVTTIGDNAFFLCDGFTGSLTIGNSVTTIGSRAFGYCEGLTGDLTIPESVITIESGAFEHCRGFTGSLTIGNSVTTIENYAFIECSGFMGDLTIPESVITIGQSAFDGCTGFTGNLTIGNSVTTIGRRAFYGCRGFRGSLTIGNSVTNIGDYAFRDCMGFRGSLTIGNSVTTIGDHAFYNCTILSGVLNIPNSVTTIGECAFGHCQALSGDLIIPNSVTTIGDDAFNDCMNLKSLTISNSVTTIGENVFRGCGFRGDLTIPNSVTTIGKSAFRDCRNLTGSLTIGNSVTTIGEGAFYDCGFRGDLIIPNSVTTIGDYAFEDCSFTGSLTIGNSVTTIGNRAFEDCGFTGSLTIGNSVTRIGFYAFSIKGTFAFIVCESIIPPDCTYNYSWPRFGSDQYSKPLYVPAQSVDDYKTAEEWKNFYYIRGIGEIMVESITLNESSYQLTIQETIQLNAMVLPEEATDKSVIWTSSDNMVAKVDENGLVTAIKVGQAIITATTSNGLTATCKVTVNPVLASSVTLNVQDITLLVGATDKLTATVSPENVTNPVITWSSDNESIATVDANGNVTAVAVGVANITAKCGDVAATCKVTVNPVPASSVTLNVQDITLLVGAIDKLTATVSPENVTNPVITWSSDNEAIATVDADGNVTAVSVGVANITAKCGDVTATCKVTVESLAECPEAPTQMLRKGNGSSCTFIAMMAITDTEIEQEGYSFVYGYTDATGNDNVIAKTNVRYCHTTPAVYNNSANDFWVFTVRVDDNGEMIGSERRHLDGSVDDDYDLSALIGRSRGIDGSDPDNWITATSRGALITVESADAVVVTVCSLGGQVVMRQETAAGTMVSQEINGDIIAPNIYVIRVDCGGKNVSKKVIIR